MEDVEINGVKLRAYKNLPPSIRALWQLVAIANMLIEEFGCKKGDRIAIASRNLPEWILTFFAIQLFGGVAVAVNAWLTPSTLEHCLTITECKVVVLDAERAKVAKAFTKSIEKSGVKGILVFRTPSPPAGMRSFDECVKKYEGRNEEPEADVAPEDVATIFFTSGVIGTNRQLLTNIFNSLIPSVRAGLRRGEEIPTPGPNDKQKAILLGVPLFHATGCHSSLGVMTVSGGKVVMMYKWNIDVAAKLIVDEKVTTAGGMPFMAMELIDSIITKGGHTLEAIGYGGGPASQALPESIKSRCKTDPQQGYGATELSSACCNFQGEDYVLRPGSTGLPCLINDIKTVDENGKTLPAGGVGEIYVKGVNRCNGYWKNEKATKEVFLDDGYYKTGDIGYLDKEGFLYILDRSKDMIIRGGENIATVTVESALYEDDRVLDAAVVPVPDPKLGELVAAVVVTKPDHHGKVSEAELISFVTSRLPKHCIPVMIDVRQETLPRSGIGKTLKTTLRTECSKLWETRKGAAKAKL
ncbi:hypothetical protein MNV49_006281 [Pseudohyphozyma bogoriensis]|nr:hypothetical protein MNV49_006281 [Pseudohyphozyma bogoriensis]